MEILKVDDLKGVMDYLKVTSEFIRNNLPEGSPQREWDFINMDDFILRKGTAWMNIDRNHSYGQGEMKECFFNAHRVAMHHGLRYVEGYAAGIIPVFHAWNLTEEGVVVDTTWDDGKAYFGVELPLWYANRIMMERERYGVLDAWEIKWPLITGEHRWPLDRNQFYKRERRA